MSNKKEILDTILDTAKTVVESSKFQSFICGTYDDGTPRCFADSWNNVTYSPQQRKEKEEICERIKNDKIEPFSFTAEVKTKGKKKKVKVEAKSKDKKQKKKNKKKAKINFQL